MTGRNRAVLARDASARLVGASCEGQAKLWNAQENDYLTARTPAEAEDAAETVLVLCDDCPVLDLCQEWAAVERYTGLAAGSAWIGGRRRKSTRRPAEVPLAS